MKPVRLIKRQESSTATTPEPASVPVSKPEPRQPVTHWMKEKQRATPTAARRAFAALFPVAT